jgi:hypothetical protein
VRNGETDSGFEQIKRAMVGDPQLAMPAVAFAYQFFDGDLDQVRSVTGNVVSANSALAVLLARQKRYDEASVVWQAIGSYDSDAIVSSGRSLVNELISAKKFAEALKVNATIDTSSAFLAEKIADGGFEDAVKLEGASPFDWQIGQGSQPQVLQSTSQPHGGERSLVLRYSSNDGNGLKSISQTVVVRPNSKYSITGFYHSDIKSDGKLVWQVTDAASGAVIGESTLAPANGWTGFSVDFRLGNADAVVVQFMVKSCGSALCPISGSIWFDDIELKPV